MAKQEKKRRGRPPTGLPRRDLEIRARVSPAEKALIAKAATLAGHDVSQRVRYLLLRDAKRIITRHEKA